MVSALATLAYDGRRGAFFESQLIAALKIIANGDVSARGMTGSWAGAMGHTQFLPTSYLAYAVDFTGDGRRGVAASPVLAQDPVDDGDLADAGRPRQGQDAVSLGEGTADEPGRDLFGDAEIAIGFDDEIDDEIT